MIVQESQSKIYVVFFVFRFNYVDGFTIKINIIQKVHKYLFQKSSKTSQKRSEFSLLMRAGAREECFSFAFVEYVHFTPFLLLDK